MNSALTPPDPRRSDDAFSRSVVADVDAARAKRFSILPLVALPGAAAAALALFISTTTVPAPEAPSGAALMALVEREVDAADAVDSFDADLDRFADEDLIAFVDAGDVAALDTAITGVTLDPIEGSSEQDLQAVEAALDQALREL